MFFAILFLRIIKIYSFRHSSYFINYFFIKKQYNFMFPLQNQFLNIHVIILRILGTYIFKHSLHYYIYSQAFLSVLISYRFPVLSCTKNISGFPFSISSLFSFKNLLNLSICHSKSTDSSSSNVIGSFV